MRRKKIMKLNDIVQMWNDVSEEMAQATSSDPIRGSESPRFPLRVSETTTRTNTKRWCRA